MGLTTPRRLLQSDQYAAFATCMFPMQARLICVLIFAYIPWQTPSGQDQDILHWWKSHTSAFPNLTKMARQFLAAPASSTSSERLFSFAGKMHDDLKKSTAEETLEDMLTVSKKNPDA